MEGAGILGCVDLIVLADHGMAPSPPGEKFLIMDDYVPDILNDARIYDGVFPTIRPKLDTEGERNVGSSWYFPNRRCVSQLEIGPFVRDHMDICQSL